MGILKEGDKVRIKSLKWYRDNCNGGSGVETEGNTFVADMKEYCGREAIITNYFSDTHFHIDIDGENWGWTIGMIEIDEKEFIGEPNYNDVFKFGEFYVKVDIRNKTIYPEFFNSKDEAECWRQSEISE
jgi:hypothetical protein